MASPLVQPLKLGTYLRQYRIETQLASGGFSHVYRVSREKDTALYILKECIFSQATLKRNEYGALVVSRPSAEIQPIIHGFLKEARWLARLPQPYFPKLIDCFAANNTAYMVLDDPHGVPLSQAFYSEAPWQRWLERVLEAITTLHDHGILHLDIKPNNVLICPNNHIQLIDFSSGAERCLNPTTFVDSAVSDGFAAPEQYEQHASLTTATDLYAFGALVFYCINRGISPQSADTRVSDDALGEWLEFHRDYSVWHSIAALCLRYASNERPQRASFLREMLEKAPHEARWLRDDES